MGIFCEFFVNICKLFVKDLTNSVSAGTVINKGVIGVCAASAIGQRSQYTRSNNANNEPSVHKIHPSRDHNVQKGTMQTMKQVFLDLFRDHSTRSALKRQMKHRS